MLGVVLNGVLGLLFQGMLSETDSKVAFLHLTLIGVTTNNRPKYRDVSFKTVHLQ